MREGVCTSTSSGVLAYRPEIQHADTGAWVPFSSTVGGDGTVLSTSDTVSRRALLTLFPASGTTNGSMLWPIPWRAQVRGGGTNGPIVLANTLNHHETYTASSRKLKMSKGNRSKGRTVP